MYLFTTIFLFHLPIHFDSLSFWSQMSLRWIRVMLLFFINTVGFYRAFTSQTRKFKLHMQQPGFQKSYLSLNIYFIIDSTFWSPLKAFKSVSCSANTVSVAATHFPLYFLSLVLPLSSACLSVIRLFLSCMMSASGSTQNCAVAFFTARVVLRRPRHSVPDAHRLISSMKCCIWILCTGVAALISVHLEASPLCWESVDLGAIWCNSSGFSDKALFP